VYFFSSLIGAISGEIVEAIVHKDHTSTVICWIFGAIIGGIFYNNGFIVSLPVVPAFASIGYAIGVPIKERAEIKRREELERERIRREEERRRREYELEIKKLELKLKQWKEEGYNVSELEEMLRREEEGRRKEYEQKMKEVELKLKQWKEKGYDVSELEEMLK